MRANRSDSSLERALRSALHVRGLRFRKHHEPIPGLRCRPDVVFTRARLAVFVDGGGERSFAANVARDRRTDRALIAAGWHVLRLWEHQPLSEMVDAVMHALTAARAGTLHES